MIQLICQCDWLMGRPLNGYRLSEEAVAQAYEKLLGVPVHDVMGEEKQQIGRVTAVDPENNTFTIEAQERPELMDEEMLALMRPALCIYTQSVARERPALIDHIEGVRSVGFTGKLDGEVGSVKKV